MALLSSILLLIAAPALADQAGPAPDAREFVNPASLQARADALRDAVSDRSVSDVFVKEQGNGFFDKLPAQSLVVPTGAYRRMEREPVSGKLGSIEGMTDEADARVAAWKRTHAEPPPPELEAAVAQGRALRDGKRLSYDTQGRLSDNQMGIFQYATDRLDGGFVKLNERMKILGALVGNAFTYATVVHESRHAGDRERGALTPEQVVAGEVSAFRVQYQWLKLMDPTGERMLMLHAKLRLWRDREPDPEIKVVLNQAVVYLEHLSDVVSTNGDEDELKKLVEKLGYEDGHEHGDGRGHGRDAALPTSA